MFVVTLNYLRFEREKDWGGGGSASPVICQDLITDVKHRAVGEGGGTSRSFRGLQGGWEVLPPVAASIAISVTAATTKPPRV